MKAKLFFLALMTSALFSGVAQASELKVGFVSIERIYREAPISIKASKRMEDQFSKRKKDMVEAEEAIKRFQENLEKNTPVMSDSERLAKQKELESKMRDLQRKNREFQEDLNLRRNEEMSQILEKANAAVRLLAEREKFDLILQDAVYTSPRIDITDRVIKALSEVK